MCLELFFPPIDIQQALIQHTQCPCRFVILATKALQSQAWRQTYIYIANATRHQEVHILMRVASGLFSWSMVAGLLAFSSRQFALKIDHEPCFIPGTVFSSYASVAGGVCRPRSEAPCINTYNCSSIRTGLVLQVPATTRACNA